MSNKQTPRVGISPAREATPRAAGRDAPRQGEQRLSGLGLELIELSHALESVRLVSDCERTRSFADAADARVAPRAVSATVGLVSQRLRALAAALSVNDQGLGPESPAPARPRRRSTK